MRKYCRRCVNNASERLLLVCPGGLEKTANLVKGDLLLSAITCMAESCPRLFRVCSKLICLLGMPLSFLSFIYFMNRFGSFGDDLGKSTKVAFTKKCGNQSCFGSVTGRYI